jgi:hypothetical protein
MEAATGATLDAASVKGERTDVGGRAGVGGSHSRPGPHVRERRGRGLFVGGYCVCGGDTTHTGGGGSIGERATWQQAEASRAAAGRGALLLFGGGKDAA